MIIRTYRCNDCQELFEVTCESSDGDPDCPFCARELVWQPKSFAITTTKSKAVDVTQQIMEEDYGLTDFNDNMREGDIAAKTPVRPRAEREAIEQARLARLRPVLMTGMVAALGFVPMMLSTGIGSEVQKPLATVVFFGMVCDTFLTMLALPVLYLLFGRGPESPGTLPESFGGSTRVEADAIA